ncbi:MAG: hypothetical protein IT428_12660 [Planctomycetaceae bacterium]|nr:hypothetical protein [Planctomycetaceae bacterium]
MHEVYDHRDRGVNAAITIEADDARQFGVSSFYSVKVEDGSAAPLVVCIPFQERWDGNSALRGVTEEALCAVLIDRLRSIQMGPLANTETNRALVYTQKALHALKQRPRLRTIASGTPTPFEAVDHETTSLRIIDESLGESPGAG